MVASYRTGDKICLLLGKSGRTEYSIEPSNLEFGVALETFEVSRQQTEVLVSILVPADIPALTAQWSCKVPYLEAEVASLDKRHYTAAVVEAASQQHSVGQLAPVVQPSLLLRRRHAVRVVLVVHLGIFGARPLFVSLDHAQWPRFLASELRAWQLL
ncbi:hypothetical protein HG531_012323 [Fusarium graminearum]|nr:hypothetical protein HG531_012323 [Fusarium graminearum]